MSNKRRTNSCKRGTIIEIPAKMQRNTTGYDYTRPGLRIDLHKRSGDGKRGIAMVENGECGVKTFRDSVLFIVVHSA